MIFKNKFVPWNKGKTVGQKKPLTFEQADKIKAYLERSNRLRDLALFSCAFDTMLRGIDLLNIRVGDIQRSNGLVKDEFFMRQRKTGNSVLVGLTPYSQAVLYRWITEAGLSANDYLFMRQRGCENQAITTDQYRKLVKSWVRAIGLDPADYSTHSLRRSKAVMVYEETNKIDAVMCLLGHRNLSSTTFYLNTDRHDALEVARGFHF